MGWDGRKGMESEYLNWIIVKMLNVKILFMFRRYFKDIVFFMFSKYKNFVIECYKFYLRDLLKVCFKLLGIRVDVIVG